MGARRVVVAPPEGTQAKLQGVPPRDASARSQQDQREAVVMGPRLRRAVRRGIARGRRGQQSSPKDSEHPAPQAPFVRPGARAADGPRQVLEHALARARRGHHRECPPLPVGPPVCTSTGEYASMSLYTRGPAPLRGGPHELRRAQAHGPSSPHVRSQRGHAPPNPRVGRAPGRPLRRSQERRRPAGFVRVAVADPVCIMSVQYFTNNVTPVYKSCNKVCISNTKS